MMELGRKESDLLAFHARREGITSCDWMWFFMESSLGHDGGRNGRPNSHC